MTAGLQPQSKPSSRRALLVGALSGLGAFAASAIGRGDRVLAGVDGDVVLGAGNVATSTTSITNSANENTVFLAEGTSGIGVLGRSSSDFGVAGTSFTGTGVQGSSDAADLAGTVGLSRGNGTGVLGTSTNGPPVLPLGKAKTGVFGYAAQDSTAIGVHGESVSGIGTVGLATATTGATFGVFGRSNSSGGAGVAGRGAANRTGVMGFSGSGTFPASKSKTGVYGRAAQDSASKGVWGNSPAGHGIHGESNSGWAGYFDGRVLVNRYAELVEIATPSAPGSNHARLFVRDNGSGKTQLCVRFHTGAVRVLATQP